MMSRPKLNILPGETRNTTPALMNEAVEGEMR